MGRKRKQKRERQRHGHFCWSCRCHRPNEAFSGKGHRRHLCRECAKLPSEELQLRQTLKDVDRLVGRYLPLIPRRLRPRLERYLEHPNPKVREAVQQLFAEHEREVAYLRELEEREEARLDALAELFPRDEFDRDDFEERDDFEGDDIPF